MQLIENKRRRRALIATLLHFSNHNSVSIGNGRKPLIIREKVAKSRQDTFGRLSAGAGGTKCGKQQVPHANQKTIGIRDDSIRAKATAKPGGDNETLFRVADASVAAHEALAAARQRDGSGAGSVYGFSDGQNSTETGRHDPAGRLCAGSFRDCVQAGDVLGFRNFRRERMRTFLVGRRLERGNFSRALPLRAGLDGEAETCQRQQDEC